MADDLTSTELTHRDSRASEISRIAGQVVARLTARGETVACAESLTGGWLKATWLGVDRQLLAKHGAVHPAVAGDMALGVCRAAGSHWGLATTGVAGPGPSDGKPAGTAYVAVAVGARVCAVRELDIPGDRSAVRAGTVLAALALLVQQVDED